MVLDRTFDFELATKLLHGITLEEGWAKAESVYKLGSNKLKVVLKQGMKRQIRLMFYALGYEVKRLVRVRIGPLQMQGMPPGSWRVLTQKEIDALLAEGAKAAAEPAERRPRKARPSLRSTFKRNPASDRPARSRVEEIPFALRANRGEGTGEKSGERPRPARPSHPRSFGKPAPRSGDGDKAGPRTDFKPGPRKGGKPFAKKPVGSKTAKPAGRPAGKPTPAAFAKFERRRRSE